MLLLDAVPLLEADMVCVCFLHFTKHCALLVIGHHLSSYAKFAFSLKTISEVTSCKSSRILNLVSALTHCS